MNTTESTKETEFVFRRLGESFVQFVTDFWQAIPLWLFILACVAVVAKIGYDRYARRTRGPGRPDATQHRLWWASFATGHRSHRLDAGSVLPPRRGTGEGRHSASARRHFQRRDVVRVRRGPVRARLCVRDSDVHQRTASPSGGSGPSSSRFCGSRFTRSSASCSCSPQSRRRTRPKRNPVSSSLSTFPRV